ncbi:MAG: RibD family protein [Acidobacteriota bacterium]|nr:RibD family protein [Acidobacteriota bacterium]
MKPYVICHMTSSVDGRALVPQWHPGDAVPEGLWAAAKSRLAVQGSINGRVTGLEFALGDRYPERTDQSFPRTDRLPSAGLPDYRVVVDPHGTIAWGRGDVDGTPIVVALLTSVSDSHLAGLRKDGVHYLFAGDDEIDLHQLLDKLGSLGIRSVRLGGGPVTSGQFLHAGLIDEISLLLVPAIDGWSGGPTIFEHPGERDLPALPVSRVELTSSEVLDGGVLWLRYRLHQRLADALVGLDDTGGHAGQSVR